MAVKCPKCQTENPDTSSYCADCGTQLVPIKDVSVTKTLQKSLAFPGKTIASKYKILEEVGRGGMGVVCKAKDTRLKRTVALKFLPPELTKDKVAKDRFIQEAQAAAALNHPQICIIYEVDEAEDQTFIAMEFIEGQSLKDKLKFGPMDIDEAKDIAIQVAKGLEKAHKKGIIHRDIKPANIMINEEGYAKITDFGLAKLSWGVDLTKTATIMGTVAYMSPEQARGEEVDHRTDIWSLGAMLYEMLSGERPFQKSQEQALIYAILNDKPTPLSLLRSDVPSHIEHLIEKSLEKKASERYQDIQELIQDLKLFITFPKAEKSIVVLPFENLSPDPEQEYFCDGMTEEIITDLSHVHDLLVISRSSAMTFKGTKKKIKEIAREVNVQYVLEGSVRKAGNNLRITAQLIDAANDAHLWAEKYSGTLDDVFDIQEKVSRSIVNALKLKLSPEEKQRITERPIDNVVAYEYWLKASAEITKFTEKALDRALRYLQNALDMMGDNAYLYVGMGFAYWNYVNIGIKQEDFVAKAEECVNKALALDPEFPIAHALLGFITMFFWGDPQKGVFHLKKALAFNPDELLALQMLAAAYVQLVGKMSAAVPLVERLMQIDPLGFPTKWLQGQIHFYDGRFDQAFMHWSKLYELEPEHPVCRTYYAIILAYQNRLTEAISIIDQSVKTTPENAFTKLGLLLKYAMLNKEKKVFQELTPDLRKTYRRDGGYSRFLAGIFALLDAKAEALDWLENAVNRGFLNYPFLAEGDPFLENIRGEPRFKKLMQRVKHEWENFEV